VPPADEDLLPFHPRTIDAPGAQLHAVERNPGPTPVRQQHRPLPRGGVAPRAFGQGMDEAQTLALFRAVQCPVQVMHGTLGYSFDDAQMRERLAALRAREPLAVRGSHHVHLDSPGEVAALVARFATGL
jgi:pimeloyl-ACP methyl ester carboxylesterase